jgi:23S rRNA pseudouridine2604 synthase
VKAQPPKKPEFPMRINKYLAWKNVATRKGGDDLVIKKRVLINGRIAVLGDKVTESDIVEVKKGGKQKEYQYFAYNKPIGITTHSPGRGQKDIARTIPLKGVFPIGRLDRDSHGLMILTDDGRITDKLLSPEYEHEKEYKVKTKNKLRTSFKSKMEAGVNIEGYVTKPSSVRILGDNAFTVVLTEGKKHQIRRMCSALFQEVNDLERTRIMNIKLGNLPAGSTRPILGKELDEFLSLLGFTKN